MPKPLRKNRRGFTLAEALVAMTIVVMAASVMMMAVETSVSTANDSVETTIAQGMARQLIDEVMGQRYHAVGGSPYQYPMSTSSWERAGDGRERFNDTDDYHGFVADGAEDVYGKPLGQGEGDGNLRPENLRVRDGYFDAWQQKIEVYYVDPNDLKVRLAAQETSSFRAIEVTISRRTPDGDMRVLANQRRVFSYVPAPATN